MKKVLITGATGFVGKYLCDLLSKEGYEVFGTSLEEKSSDKLKIYKLDLMDWNETKSLIAKVSPDIIFHLAALTSPRDSFKNPKDTLVNNISAQVNILEAVREVKIDPKILIISSGEIYGKVDAANLPIDEETPLNPSNPYAVSKLSQDFLGLQYFNSYGLKIIRVRPFNHTGPGQPPVFVIPAFAKKIAEIEKGKLNKLTVGNLDSKRDFTDVRDVVRAYVLAVEKGKPGDVYNLGSGKSYKILDILNSLISLSSAKIKVEEDESLMMPSDNPELVCDFSKFAQITSWKPEIPIQKTLSDTLDYWRRIP